MSEDEGDSPPKQSLPTKSKLRYEKIYLDFKKWLRSKNTNKVSEDRVLEFFTEKSKILNSSTLYSNYSKLNKALQFHDDMTITRYPKVKDFLKTVTATYVPKKSKVFEMEHVIKFLNEAPNDKYLMMKVVVIMGISGACRKSELVDLKIDDVNDQGNKLTVNVLDIRINAQRTFVVSNKHNLDLLKLYRDYVALRPTSMDTQRLFIRYCNGKCFRRVVGKNILAKIPQQIADFLQLPDARLYTGQCFRRTAATLCFKDCNKPTIEASSQVAQVYISEPKMEWKIESEDDVHKTEASSDSDCEGTATRTQSLPVKSQEKYKKVYVEFKAWLISTPTNAIDEDTLREYFTEKSKLLSTSTLCSLYCMLKSTLKIHENIDIGIYPRLKHFAERDYAPKECKVFEIGQIERFLNDAPNKTYLMVKVALVMALSGACHKYELITLKVDDVEDQTSRLLVKVADARTCTQRTFVVSNKQNLNFLELYRSYVALRPSEIETRRLFLRYSNGRCFRQVVGKTIFGRMPQQIAEFLRLPQVELYTRHCFRSTAASLRFHDCDESAPPKLQQESVVDCKIETKQEESCASSIAIGAESDLQYEDAASAVTQPLPEKSKQQYKKSYLDLKKWLKSKGASVVSDNKMVAFFAEKAKIWNSLTMWNNYSILKKTLRFHENVDISMYSKLRRFLQSKGAEYVPKQTKTFKKEHIVRFLNEAPNKKYLMMKVFFMLGIAGPCSRSELVSLRIDDIEDQEDKLIVRVPNNRKTFVVSNERNINFVKLYRDYVALRSPSLNTTRLFLKYSNGRCFQIVVGKNSFTQIPQQIAAFLKLPDARLYTGHCFRKTASALRATNCNYCTTSEDADFVDSKIEISEDALSFDKSSIGAVAGDNVKRRETKTELSGELSSQAGIHIKTEIPDDILITNNVAIYLKPCEEPEDYDDDSFNIKLENLEDLSSEWIPD